MGKRVIEVEIIGSAKSLVAASATGSAALGKVGTAAEQAAAKQHAGGQVIGKAAKYGAIAVGGLAAASIKAAGDFESTLNTFQAVSGATGGEMRKVGAVAKQLGNDIHIPGASASDAADAMTELAKGGLNVRDSMSAAKATLILAAAAQTSNAEAATITARALNTFSLKGKDAARVTDVLAGAANASTLEISDVAQGFQQAGSSAAALGIPIQDLATQLGLMANKGIAGSDAGTSLKTMLTRLNPSTMKAGDEVDKLGIHVYDAHGKFIGIRGAIAQYSAALGKLSPEQRQSAVNTIFGSDAQRAANIVLNGGVNAYDKMHDAVTKHGAAQAMADAKMKGFKGSMEAFKSTVETLAINFGQVLLPAATAVMHVFAGATNTIGEHKTVVMVLVGVIGSLSLAIVTVNAITKAYRATQLALASVQVGLTAVTGGFSTAFLALNAAMVANPIGLVVVAIGVLVGAFVLAYSKSETFRNIITGAFNAVKNVAETAFGLIKTAAEYGLLGPIGLIITHWQDGRDALIAVFNKVKEVAQSVWNAVRNYILDPMRDARDAVGDVVRAIRDKVGDAWGGVKSVISKVADGIKGALTAPFNDAWDFISGIVGKIKGAIQSIKNLPGKLLGKITGNATGDLSSSGGLRVVGERGPELVHMPRGARVQPHSESGAALAGMSGGGTTINFNGPVGSQRAARAVAAELSYRLRFG